MSKGYTQVQALLGGWAAWVADGGATEPAAATVPPIQPAPVPTPTPTPAPVEAKKSTPTKTTSKARTRHGRRRPVKRSATAH